ncbi:MAG TPA: hypothetical protein VG325_12345 [Solirubrobacteraceae bacterium]|jgi:hypothetical protein|nr:hypothetical protein [Solirubrobacteraceae bacterium]
MSLLLAAAESSKTSFYILGGALALWAVILAGLGLSRPDFPGGQGGVRGVMGLTLVMVILAIGAAILTS